MIYQKGYGNSAFERADVRRLCRLLSAPTRSRFDDDLRRRVVEYQKCKKLQVDGLIGPETLRSLYRNQPDRRLVWGAKVSTDFKRKLLDIGRDLVVDGDFLMSAIAFETAETFSPTIRNAAGSGAIGLIQFMPSTAARLLDLPPSNKQAAADAFAAMSAIEQLDQVAAYFRPYRNRLLTIDDVYLAILYPKAVGKPPGYTLFSGETIAYRQNAGLDADRDGRVTKREAAAKVRDKLVRGEAFLA